MAYQSLRVRFFRSMITTLSLVLAISFFTFIQVTNRIGTAFLQTNNPVFATKLAAQGYDVDDSSATIESSSKQRWILFLSLLVCVVGIVNAQLMSVTERFREIGTMKCLGALDRFVLRLFLLEAGMQGVIGGVSGALAGGLAAVANSGFRFHVWIFNYTSFRDLVPSLVYAALLGCALSLAGVLYPALLAAHMQPIEAMRTEA